MRKKHLFVFSCLSLGVLSVGATGVAVTLNSSMSMNRAVNEGIVYPSVTLDKNNLLTNETLVNGEKTISTIKYGSFSLLLAGISYDSGNDLFTIAGNASGYIVVNTISKLDNGHGGQGYFKGSSVNGTNIGFRGHSGAVTKPYISQKELIDISSKTTSFSNSASWQNVSFGTFTYSGDTVGTFRSVTFYWSCA